MIEWSGFFKMDANQALCSTSLNIDILIYIYILMINYRKRERREKILHHVLYVLFKKLVSYLQSHPTNPTKQE